MSDDDFGVQYKAPRTQPYRVGALFFLPHQCDEWVIGVGDQAVEETKRHPATLVAQPPSHVIPPLHHSADRRVGARGFRHAANISFPTERSR